MAPQPWRVALRLGIAALFDPACTYQHSQLLVTDRRDAVLPPHCPGAETRAARGSTRGATGRGAARSSARTTAAAFLAVTLVHDDPDGAEDVLLQLSELLRASLDKLHVQQIPLRREIELLNHYMSIQQRRFGERLRFDVQVDPGLLDCAVPTLILQPLVENAVRYGVGRHKENDLVTFRAWRNRDALCLEISNRTGVLDGEPEQLFTRGVGLSNTRRRLEQLYGERQALDIFDGRPSGVGVRLSLPAHAMENDVSALPAGVAP